MTKHRPSYQQYRELKKRMTGVAKFGPTELPELREGEQRLFFTRTFLLDFIKSGDFDRLLDKHDLVTRMTFDGLFAVDVVEKSVASVEVSAAKAGA